MVLFVLYFRCSVTRSFKKQFKNLFLRLLMGTVQVGYADFKVVHPKKFLQLKRRVYRDHVAVKSRMMPGGQVHTQRCLLSVSIGDLKNQLAAELRIPPAVLILTKDGS